MVENLILKIKRREGWWADALYRLAITGRRLHVPYVPWLHDLLYRERLIRRGAWERLKCIAYYEPLMKSRCVSVGKNFRLIQALPVMGGNLQIYIGDDVTIDGTNTFAANRVYDKPRLVIGDHCFVGWHVGISVGLEVTIGKYCLIGHRVLIADHDMHPVDWEKRRLNLIVERDRVRPVHIGDDVWIGAGCFILKGVTIGKGAIIGAGSVVVHDVPEHCVAAGIPARVVRDLRSEQKSH